MTALIIGEPERALIRAMIERAAKHPIPLDVLMKSAIPEPKSTVTLADRKPGFERPPSEHLIIPMGYRVAFSFEQQPSGLCRHLSISVARPGFVPNKIAAETIIQEFGFSPLPHEHCSVWLEEFDPGHYAINAVELVNPAPHGPPNPIARG